jgi:hypothetical protein
MMILTSNKFLWNVSIFFPPVVIFCPPPPQCKATSLKLRSSPPQKKIKITLIDDGDLHATDDKTKIRLLSSSYFLLIKITTMKKRNGYLYATMQDLTHTHNSHPISIPNSSNNITVKGDIPYLFFLEKNISKQFQNNWADHYFQVISLQVGTILGVLLKSTSRSS